jgi:hypothetical protein
MKRARRVFCFLALAAVAVAPLHAETVELGASKDNTIFSEGDLSNGAGIHLFTGATLMGNERRALVFFDIASWLPAGATIDNVTLTMTMSRTIVGPWPVSVHRVLADWGEGNSDAPGQEGGGAPADLFDATWTHTFFNTSFWNTPGGDFAPVASATTDVDQDGPYTWTSGDMILDVQDWLDSGDNFGWIVVIPDLDDVTAKRFNTREHSDPATRPTLTIEFTPPSEDGGGDGGGVPATNDLGIVLLALALLGLGTLARKGSRSRA